MFDEVYDLVDENDSVVGITSRAEAHDLGMRHRAVHVFLFNASGELFVQQRSASKDTNPLKRGSSMGGHVDLDETYEHAAVRELQEELGLTVGENELLPLHKFPPMKINWTEFALLFRVDYLPDRHGPIVLSREECESGAWWPLEKIEASIASSAAEWTPDFVHYFRWMRSQK